MIDHVWTVVCSQAIVDRDSNNVSLQNVIEQITIADVPKPDGIIPLGLQVMTLWARSDFDVPSRGQARLTLLLPSGKSAKEFESILDLSEARRLRTGLRVEGFPASESGRYSFRVEFRNEGEELWHLGATVPIEVVFEPPKAEQTMAE